jgi:hypothetical protein
MAPISMAHPGNSEKNRNGGKRMMVLLDLVIVVI